jgi:hypothetical protein
MSTSFGSIAQHLQQRSAQPATVNQEQTASKSEVPKSVEILPPAFQDLMRNAGFPLGEVSPHLLPRAPHPGLTPLMSSGVSALPLPDFSLGSSAMASPLLPPQVRMNSGFQPPFMSLSSSLG